MRKAKEDALLTKEDIMEAAFKCFFDHGFKNTSLEMIAREADVTRGAVYWHFKDKKELYNEVVLKTLEEADVVKYAYDLPEELTYQQRLNEMFCFAQFDNKKVDFVYKTLNIVSQNDDFKDLHDAIQIEKIKLFRYFVEETRMHIRAEGLKTLKPEYYASDLFLLFEGLFLTKHVSVGMLRDQEHIKKYVEIIIKDLI